MKTEQNSIRLNCQTVDNLINYLKSFNKDATVVIHEQDKTGAYNDYDCVIGCNIEFQHQNNKVVLFPGLPTSLISYKK